MKKRLSILLMAATLLFAGCQEGAPVNVPGTTNAPEGMEKDQPVVGEDTTETPDAEKETEPTATLEPKKVEPKLYDRLAAWDDFYKEYNSYYTAIQIEDMFLHPGMLGSELAEVVAAGKDTAITPVSLDMLINPDEKENLKETQKVTYCRNGIPWFDVYVRNYSGDLLPFGDSIVSLIVPCKAAMEYCRFFDGTYSLSSIKEISYKDYDKFAASLENTGYTIEKDGGTWSVSSTDEFCPASLSEKVLYWTKQKLSLELEVDMETGYISTMNIPESRMLSESTYELFTAPVPEDFDWSSPEVKKCLNEFTEVLGTDSQVFVGAESTEVISVLKGNEEKNEFILVYYLYKNSVSESTFYELCRVEDIKVDYLGNLAMPDEIKSGYWDLTYADEPSYADALITAKNKFGRDWTTELLCEYKEDLIREYKPVTSFADLSKEQLIEMIEYGIRGVSTEWGWTVNKIAPIYLSLCDGGKEDQTFEDARLWLIYYITYTNGYAQIAHVGLQDLFVNEENNTSFCNIEFGETGKGGKTYEYMKEAWQLDGTPEESKWITEYLPASFVKTLENKYGYVIDEESIDWTK